MIDTKKFTLFISLCAVFAVNPVLANAPNSDSDLGTDHNVYVEHTEANGTLPKVEGYATNGIASVSYVNRMVDAAGNAADAAEKHAAAAGAYAISAAGSADEAKGALSDKLDKALGASNANKVMITDTSGKVVPVVITSAGSGNLVTSVSVSEGKLTVTKGSTLPTGSLASKNTISNADVANNAAIAQSKIDGLTGALNGKQPKSSAAYQMGNATGGWTTMTTAQQNALNSGIDADKVSVYEGYATGKQDKLTTDNIMGSGSVNVTVDNGVITVSGTDKDTTYSAGSNVSISNGAVSVATANGSTLGVVKAGSNVSISDGAVSVATANGSTLGVVKAGSNVSISSGTVSVATANGSTLGVVKEGSNVSISSGAVSVADATATVKGVAKLGVIPSGTNKTGTAEIWVE